MTNVVPPRRKPRPWFLYTIWTVLIVTLLAWTGWWFALRGQVIAHIEGWAASQRAAGAEASYRRISASGFPLRLTLTFEDALYAPAGGGWRLSTPRVQLHINPSDLSLFILEPRAAVTWATRGVTRSFTPHESAISVHVIAGKADRVIAEGKQVAITRNGAPEMNVGSFVAGVRPDPRAPGDGQFSLDADAITLASSPKGFEAFGEDVKTLNARIVFEKGALLLAQGQDTLSAWAKAGGAARIDGLGFAWGPATFTSTGRFKLDDQRRLDGILDMSLDKPADAFTALSQSTTISPDLALLYKMMAQANAQKGEPLKAPLTITNGVMSFNNLPLRTVDPIK
jgi:hypothetical protein